MKSLSKEILFPIFHSLLVQGKYLSHFGNMLVIIILK